MLVQKFVHALEVGRFKVWMQRALILVAILGICTFYLLHEFKGLATSQAMDQAQIGREIASGHGWSTKLIRPLAIGQLLRHGKKVSDAICLDTYNAPLPPLVDAVALLLAGKSSWKFNPAYPIYRADLLIALLSEAMFVASVWVFYLIAIELFDLLVARLACGLTLVCETMWRYSISGLPQMLLLFLFSLTTFALIRAIKAQQLGGRTWIWLSATGLGFGLLALAHALTIWIFVPVLVFSIIWFKPRGWAIAILLAFFFLTYSPWLARNYKACGSPLGLAIYSGMDGIGHTETGTMRRLSLSPAFSPHLFVNKVRTNLVAQFNRLFEYLGWSFAAPVALLSLLHPFRRPITAVVRWLILAMWAGAVLGMAAFGLNEEMGFAANQLHLLFLPLLTCYGLAFLLTQWNQRFDLAKEKPHWNFNTHRLLRNAGLSLLFMCSGFPLFLSFLSISANVWPVRWPPYMPVYIAMLGDWMKPNEIIASDMPWAVAWYANRKSILLPMTIKEFTNLNDYSVLGAPVNGLYLTPISGTQNSLGDICDGEYKDWVQLELRNWDVNKFPLHWAVLHGSKDCLFMSDRDRRRKSPPPIEP